jgi:flagellar biosynthesis protein FlhG
MIHDQAKSLRQLVRSQPHPRLAADGSPEIIVVTGAQHGVGTTTVAVNLAMTQALAGRRVILVDADLERGDVARLCGITDASSVIDVLSGRRSIHEVLLRGPVGVLVVPGVWAPGTAADCSATAQQRLLNQLRSLAVHADVVVIDTGSARNGFVRRFWQAADAPLIVTTPEPVAIMECYATIKVLLAGTASIPVRTLINRAPSPERAEQVGQRIAAACRRFLGTSTSAVPYLPDEPLAQPAAAAFNPLVLSSPHCEGSRAFERLTAALWPARRADSGPPKAAPGSTSAA